MFHELSYFKRSVVNFPWKKLLTPERVAGGAILNVVSFPAVGTSVWYRYEIRMPSIMILRKLPISSLRV